MEEVTRLGPHALFPKRRFFQQQRPLRAAKLNLMTHGLSFQVSRAVRDYDCVLRAATFLSWSFVFPDPYSLLFWYSLFCSSSPEALPFFAFLWELYHFVFGAISIEHLNFLFPNATVLPAESTTSKNLQKQRHCVCGQES